MLLAEQLNKYMTETGRSLAEIGHEIGYSRSSLSKYINGKYTCDPSKIEEKLINLLESKEDATPPSAASIGTGELVDGKFFESCDAMKIFGIANICKKNSEFGCVVGNSGYGKTYTLNQYARQKNVIFIECNSLMTRTDILSRLEDALGIESKNASRDRRMLKIAATFKKHKEENRNFLIIADEADKLISRDSIEKIDLFRTLYDACADRENLNRHYVGIMIVGEPKLRIWLKSLNDRYSKRIGKEYKLAGLERQEVIKYLEGLEITPQALEALAARATDKRDGSFRLLYRTLCNIHELLETARKTKITVDIVEEAIDLLPS